MEADWSQKGNLIGPLQVGYDSLPAQMEAYKLLLVAASDKIVTQNKVIGDMVKESAKEPKGITKQMAEPPAAVARIMVEKKELAAADQTPELSKNSLIWLTVAELLGKMPGVDAAPKKKAREVIGQVDEKIQGTPDPFSSLVKAISEDPENPELLMTLILGLDRIKEKPGHRVPETWNESQKNLVKVIVPKEANPRMTDAQFTFIEKLGKYDGNSVGFLTDFVLTALQNEEAVKNFLAKFFENSELLELLIQLLPQ